MRLQQDDPSKKISAEVFKFDFVHFFLWSCLTSSQKNELGVKWNKLDTISPRVQTSLSNSQTRKCFQGAIVCCQQSCKLTRTKREEKIQVHRLNYRHVRKSPTHHDPRVVPVKVECYHHYLSFPEMHLSAQIKMKTSGKKWKQEIKRRRTH